jgi:hypothetical protein
MAKRKKSDIKEEENLRKNPINLFQCLSCKDSESLSFNEFKTHLRDVHKINTDDKEQMKGSRKMTMHMDGTFWFSSTYELTMKTGLKFLQYCKNARALDDPMRFEY